MRGGDVAEAVASVERTLFETLGSAEEGDALRALAELPDRLERIEESLDGISDALNGLRELMRWRGGS